MQLLYCYGKANSKLRNYYHKRQNLFSLLLLTDHSAGFRFRVYMASRFAKKGVIRVRGAIIGMMIYFFFVYILFELSVPLIPSRPAQYV